MKVKGWLIIQNNVGKPGVNPTKHHNTTELD